jgi:hypothetical protein
MNWEEIPYGLAYIVIALLSIVIVFKYKKINSAFSLVVH